MCGCLRNMSYFFLGNGSPKSKVVVKRSQAGKPFIPLFVLFSGDVLCKILGKKVWLARTLSPLK